MPMAGAEIRPTRIEIKGATYEVTPIDPGFAGVAAVEVRKFNGESYAVTLQADGRAVCECPSYLYTHEDRGTCCKHGLAVIEAGFPEGPGPRGRHRAGPYSRGSLSWPATTSRPGEVPAGLDGADYRGRLWFSGWWA